MTRLEPRTRLLLVLILALSASTVRATTLNVTCGGKSGFTSIGSALKSLQYSEGHGPITINVTGACHENVVIHNTQQLTLNGVNGASISDASNGNADAIDVDNSVVTISGFTIDGGIDGISCYNGTYCQLLGNTIEGARDNAIFIFLTSRATINGGVLQHNGGGLGVWGADVYARSLAVQDNDGIGVSVGRGGRLSFTRSVSNDNQGYGIWLQGSNLTCNPCTVTGDQDVGVYMDSGSVAEFSGNAGPIVINSIGAGLGVLVGDLTTSIFHGTVSVTGSGGALAITCNSVTSATRNAIAAAGGAGNTNCTN